MKKFITLIFVMAITLTSINTYAQLNTMTVEEYGGFKTVYERSALGIVFGEIRYSRGEYILFGATDNDFEDSMASIVLGKSKESAILTLEDLRKIVKKEVKIDDEIVVKGCNNKYTHIYRGMGEFLIETDGVAGSSHILWRMSNKFEEAKEAIRNFKEPSES